MSLSAPLVHNAVKKSLNWHRYKPVCLLSGLQCHLHGLNLGSQAADLKCLGLLRGRHIKFDVVPQNTAFVLLTQAWHLSIAHPYAYYAGVCNYGFGIGLDTCCFFPIDKRNVMKLNWFVMWILQYS